MSLSRKIERAHFGLSLLLFCLLLGACRPAGEREHVVVYTSVDQLFSEPVLQRFEQETGISVEAVFDVEATKTTGLVNRLIAGKERPLADVFWNGEFAQTILLQKEGVLAIYQSPNAADIPAAYRDTSGAWTGFAGRARVILLNTNLVPAGSYPDSLYDFLDPIWPGEQIGIAYPIFGTTATQAAALYAVWGPEAGRRFYASLAERDLRVVDGNSVVRDMVAEGQLAFGLTDTDDACSAVEAGDPVEIVIPDQGEGELGTLIIPNTVMLIAGGPNPENGRRFIDYLLSYEVAGRLIESGWSHIALRPVHVESSCLPELAVRGMEVELDLVYEQLLPSKNDMTELFLR